MSCEGKLDKAQREEEARLRYFQGLKKSAYQQDGLAWTYFDLGRISESRGDLDAAANWFLKSVEALEGMSLAGVETLYTCLGALAVKLQNPDEAEGWFVKAIRGLEQLGASESSISWVENQLGRVEQLRGNLDEAERLYRRALEVRLKEEKRLYVGFSFLRIASVERERGNLSAAERLCFDSLEILEEWEYGPYLADAYYEMGVVQYERASFEAAESWYLKALEIHEEEQNGLGIAENCNRLAQVAEALGETDRALDLTIRCVGQYLGLRHQVASSAQMRLDRLASRFGIEAVRARWKLLEGQPFPGALKIRSCKKSS